MSDIPVVQRPRIVAVIGDGDPRGPDAHRILEMAEEVGQMLARGGATVVTGGLGGVMRAASRGARGVDGETIGILPGTDPAEANEFVRVPIATGLGVVRNLVVVTSADAVVAIGGRHGTLSEIGLALRMGRHVVTLSSWRVESDQRLGGPQVHRAKDPRDAAALALRLAKEGPAPGRLGQSTEPSLLQLEELTRVVGHLDERIAIDLPGPEMIWIDRHDAVDVPLQPSSPCRH